MLSIQRQETSYFTESYNQPLYSIFLLEKPGRFSIDFVDYETKRNSIIFLSPYQNFRWQGSESFQLSLLQFHGDFYCIEYHKKEVACNGLLFNNIYLLPYISLGTSEFRELEELLDKMKRENNHRQQFSDAVLKSYLQLFLALCSKEKSTQLDKEYSHQELQQDILQFQPLLETHFLSERSPVFYAEQLGFSPSAFSKKVKSQWGKTPTKLIQERVILEGKKLLHLTQKTIKEIAVDLHFDDEFYFSRYFKKEVGLSPTHYREKVGISIVAK